MKNKDALDLYKSIYKKQEHDRIEIIYMSRSYQHTPAYGISANIEKYNIKNHTLDSGCIIQIPTHWEKPTIIDISYYGRLRH